MTNNFWYNNYYRSRNFRHKSLQFSQVQKIANIYGRKYIWHKPGLLIKLLKSQIFILQIQFYLPDLLTILAAKISGSTVIITLL